jgi:hypothetical protein
MAEYDPMGNYTGYDDMYGYNTMPELQPTSPQFYDDFGNPVSNAEEEKRKREEIERQIEAYKKQQAELGSEVRNKQEVTTYADGSQTITTKREVPGQRAQNIQPVSPNYNANIARQESGNRPDIGYHDRSKSSATGLYGMTDAGYADARRANPNLPEDRLQATPEQQTAAMDAYTQQNAKYLQNYGVPVNENTLSAAHFAGAKGLNDYMTKKDELGRPYISPAAQRANGGYEKAAAIIEGRLRGQPAPASGAVQQPQQQVQQQQPRPRPQPITPEQSQQQAQQVQQAQQAEAQAEPAQEAPRMAPNSFDPFGTPVYSPEQAQLDTQLKTFESIQNDPKALMNFEGREWLQNNAKMRAADIMANERDNQKAQETLATATPTDLARYLQGKTKSGEDYNLATRVRAMLFSAAGQKELAMREMNKLDTVGTDKYVQGSDGKAYLVRQRADGEIMGGFNAETGSQLTPAELVKVGAGTQGAGKVSTSAEMFQDKDGNIYRSQSNEQGQLVTRNIVTGKVYAGDPTKLTRVRDVAGEAADVRKQEYKRENDATSFANSIRKLDYDSKLKAVAEFRQKAINRGEPDLTDAELSAMGVERPDIGAAPARQAAGTAPAAAQAAPTQGKLTPAVPVGGAQPVAVPPGGLKQPSVSGRMSVDEQNRIDAQNKLNRESQTAINQAVTIDKAKDYGDYYNKTAQPQGATGAQISSIRKQQLSGPDGLVNVPEIAALMQGKGGTADAIQDIFRDMVTASAYKNNQEMAEDLNRRIAALKLDSLPTQEQRERARNALYMQVRLQNQLAPLTIRDTAPVGAISDSEQRMNVNNQVDILKNPAYVSLNLLSKNKFNQDKNQARASMIEERQDFKDLATFNKEWTKESARLDKMYDDIYSARAAYIAKYKNTPAAALDAYKHYPEPSWDAEKKKWTYTGYSYRPNLNSFVK